MSIRKHFPWQLVISLLLIATVIYTVVTGIQSAAAGEMEEAQRSLEDSLHRAAVSCYAIEGCYPPTLGYLTENYGVYVDDNEFIVHYEVFASNIMPDITVLPRQEGGL